MSERMLKPPQREADHFLVEGWVTFESLPNILLRSEWWLP